MKKKKYYRVELVKRTEENEEQIMFVRHVNYELLPEFTQKWLNDGYDVHITSSSYMVVGVQDFVFPDYFEMVYTHE